MGAPAGVLITAHLIGCAFIAWLAALVAGLGENRTAAEQADAEHVAALMVGLFALAVVVFVCLLLKRWWLAVLAAAAEGVVGAVLVVVWLDESVHSDRWVLITALAIGFTGAGALVCARLELSARARARAVSG